MRLERVAETDLIAAVAVKRRQQQGNAGLPFYAPLSHHLLPLRAVVTAVAAGEWHHARFRRGLTVVLPVGGKTGRIQVPAAAAQAQPLDGLSRQPRI